MDESFAEVARQLRDSHALDLLASGFLGALLGGLAGLVIGALALLVARAAGAYRSDWAHAGWVRVPAYLLLVTAFAIGAGAYGLLEGIKRGSRVVIAKSQLATQLFPKLGDAGAELVALVHAQVVALESPSGTAVPDGAEVDVEDLFARLERLEKEVVIDTARADLRARVLARTPELRGAAREKLLDGVLWLVCDQLLKKVVRAKLEAKLEQALADHGLDVEIGRAIDAVRADARALGDPRTISRAELSACLVREVVVPAVAAPIRNFIRGQQKMVLLLLALAVIAPVIAFRVFERVRGRRGTRPA